MQIAQKVTRLESNGESTRIPFISYHILIAALFGICLLIVPANVMASASTTEQAIGSLFGTLWLDANGNGARESGEQPLANVMVYATAPDGDFGYVAKTDSSGNFEIDNMRLGSYQMHFDHEQAGSDVPNIVEISRILSADFHQTSTQQMHPLFLPLVIR